MKKKSGVEKKYSTSWDMYDFLNRELDASYIECEGDKDIRVDFSNGTSAWFRLYDSERCVEGNLTPFHAEAINKIAKKLKFKSYINQ